MKKIKHKPVSSKTEKKQVSLLPEFLKEQRTRILLGIALALANCVVPDMLPGIDEVFGIVATGGTLLHDYKKGESLPNSIVHAIDAKDVYRNCSEEYEDMDVLQIAQNVASDYATQPAYTDPMPVQQGETELEQIEHLHQLKEKGILTEKEFQEKKKQLLSQL